MAHPEQENEGGSRAPPKLCSNPASVPFVGGTMTDGRTIPLHAQVSSCSPLLRHGTPEEGYFALKTGYNYRRENPTANVEADSSERESVLAEYICPQMAQSLGNIRQSISQPHQRDPRMLRTKATVFDVALLTLSLEVVGCVMYMPPAFGDCYPGLGDNCNAPTPLPTPTPQQGSTMFSCTINGVRDWLTVHKQFTGDPVDTSIYAEKFLWKSNTDAERVMTRAQLDEQEVIYKESSNIKVTYTNWDVINIAKSSDRCTASVTVNGLRRIGNGPEKPRLVDVVFVIQISANGPQIIEEALDDHTSNH